MTYTHRASPRTTAMAVAILLGISSIFTLAAPASTVAWTESAFSTSSAADLVAMTNRSRANAGLKALKVDSRLTAVARWRSKDMIQRSYFSHTIPGYGKVWDKLADIGYCYKVGGENIGWNNYPDNLATASIHSMFMKSAGHKANIMGKSWDVIGVGAYKGPTGKKMWTVLFADKCGTAPKPTPKPTVKPKPKPTVRPVAKPTVKPVVRPVAPPPVATPEPTPELTPVPDDRSEPTGDPLAGDVPIPFEEPIPTDEADGTPDPNATPDPGPLEGEVAMRVVDGGTSEGLLETIVGGVTGFFFGG